MNRVLETLVYNKNFNNRIVIGQNAGQTQIIFVDKDRMILHPIFFDQIQDLLMIKFQKLRGHLVLRSLEYELGVLDHIRP